MRITFDSTTAENSRSNEVRDRAFHQTQTTKARAQRGYEAYRTELYHKREGTWEVAARTSSGGKTTLQELQQAAGSMDMEVIKDYRTVMSNTMSAEDYAKLEKDGFSFEQMDAQEAVTILDHIKAELARSGQNIVGYTDNLDVDTLTAAVGSRGLAQAIVKNFTENDIPITSENVNQIQKAVALAGEVETLTNEQYRYMVDNAMEPEIMSFYLAKSSVSGMDSSTQEAAKSSSTRVAGKAADSSFAVPDANIRQVSALEAGNNESASSVNYTRRQPVKPRAVARQGEMASGTNPGDTVAREIEHSDLEQAAKTLVQDSHQNEKGAISQEHRDSNSSTSNSMVTNSKASETVSYNPSQTSGSDSKSAQENPSSSNSVVDYARGPEYYADDIAGYYSKSAEKVDLEQIGGQIDAVLARAGLKEDMSAREAALWLVDQGLPLTEESLLRYVTLRNISFPVGQEQVVAAAASALCAGKSVYRGNLSDTESIYHKAAGILQDFSAMEEEAFQSRYGSLAGRRQLEEIRLHMTAEVNVRLLRSGFSIDTAPMEEFIEALKQAEGQVAAQYFPKDEQSTQKYRLYQTACDIVEDIPELPAATLGKYSSGQQEGSLETFHKEGQKLQSSYQKAGESYETLMTAPRADLGDNIRKAFANVDDILQDLGITCNETNRKAVRILGYNRMEITKENIDKVSSADRTVQSVVSQMTPAATLQMIREGVNPLEKSLEELDTYLKGRTPSYEEEAQSYSHFLYGLEQNKEIAPAERTAFIGIYRLLHQVERSDGAAVGSLVNTQAQINFSNLLSAVRTAKAGHMDAQISDSFGTVSQLIRNGLSISQQIEQGYSEDWSKVLTAVSNSQEGAVQEELNQIRRTGHCGAECEELLQRSTLSVTMENLQAAQNLLHPESSRLTEWFGKIMEQTLSSQTNSTRKNPDSVEISSGSNVENVKDLNHIENSKDTVDSLQEEASQADKEVTTIPNLWTGLEEGALFGERYRSTLNESQQEIRTMSLEKADSSMDVRELKLLHKELHVASMLSRQEEYFVPMKLEGETTLVHLTLRQSQKEKGQVSASIELGDLGHVEGHFQLRGEKLSGYLTGNNPESVKKLKQAADIFTNSTSKEWETTFIQVIEGTPSQSLLAEGESAAGDELYRIAGHFLSALSTVTEVA